MKKFHILIIVMLLALSINSQAQLNYLFSATSRPYVPVTDGITPHLISDYTPWEVEDEGLARIPIGFTFNYDNKSYTEANVSVNGFITLGDFFSTLQNFRYFQNDLARGPYSYPGERPVIAAFWDDLLLADTLDLVYKTTGHAPFRVFTIEWKKAKWVYESLAPVLSIELKLYETTNIIEFHYKDEGSLPDPRYSYASIGITSAYANRDFISLQSTSSHPEISMLRANDSLHVKPADNQVYRFIPSFIKIPAPLEPSLTYTNNKVSFKLQSGGFNSYEYAITHSPIPPSSGTRTFSPDVTVSSLSPATTYYIYGRSNWFGWLNSQWVCDSFTTAVDPVSLPFKEDFENVSPTTSFPDEMRVQTFEDTSHYFDPAYFYNYYFGAFPFFEGAGNTLLYYQVDIYDANLWTFTRGLTLQKDKAYLLKFSYGSFFEYDPSDPASLEVMYGKATGRAAMTSGVLFKKTDITNSDALRDTVIEFSPSSSGIYYFGFHNFSQLLKGALLLDNIEVSEKTPTSVTPYVLNGKTNNRDNLLNWSVNNNEVATALEIQRSADGSNFIKIADVNSTTGNKNNTTKSHATFRVYRHKESSDVASNSEKHSKALNEIKPVIEIQRSEDGINFEKLNAKTSAIGSKTNAKINHDYIDHNAEGVNYYRLKEIDKKGTISYSNVVILNNNTLSFGLKIYPNPAKDILKIELPIGMSKEMTLLVIDVSGRTILSKAVQSMQGGNLVQLDISHLIPGIYSLKLMCANGCENAVMKFEKE